MAFTGLFATAYWPMLGSCMPQRDELYLADIASSPSENVRSEITAIPWREVRSFRNIIVHHYFAIDWSTVWDTARNDVPGLEQELLEFLRQRFPEVAKRFDDERPR